MYLIIDGSSMLSTNYYGTIPREMLFAKTQEEKEKLYHKIMQSPDGKYTNGVFTSLKQILSIMREQKPEGIFVVLDRSRNTFRKELYPEYKAQRADTPAPLKEQFQTFEDVLKLIGIPVYSSDKYEADDLAGTIVKKLEADGKKCVVMSGDKDYYQLVSPNTCLWRIIPSNARERYEKQYNINFNDYTNAHNLPAGIFETRYGDGIFTDGMLIDLMPEQFVDYLAVVGDKSDNIPGVDRVGPMTIIPLLKEYGSLNKIYSAIHNANGKTKELSAEWKNKMNIKTSPINAFLSNEDNAVLSYKLAKIKTDISEIQLCDTDYHLSINQEGLKRVIEQYSMMALQKFI